MKGFELLNGIYLSFEGLTFFFFQETGENWIIQIVITYQ
jgi:hypothetical protein